MRVVDIPYLIKRHQIATCSIAMIVGELVSVTEAAQRGLAFTWLQCYCLLEVLDSVFVIALAHCGKCCSENITISVAATFTRCRDLEAFGKVCIFEHVTRRMQCSDIDLLFVPRFMSRPVCLKALFGAKCAWSKLLLDAFRASLKPATFGWCGATALASTAFRVDR